MKRILKITIVYMLVLCLAVSGLAFGAETEGSKAEAAVQPAEAEEPAKEEPAETEESETAEEAPEEPAEPEAPVLVSIADYTVVLDMYFVRGDGTEKTPEVTEVYLADKDGKKTALLKPEEYTVTYYYCTYTGPESKIYSKEMEPVTACIRPGEYKIVVTAAEESGYTGSCKALFTIAGKPQEITLSKTLYKKTTKSSDFTLKPETTGDGSGFVFESSNEDVAVVDKDGKVHITGCGEASIDIRTKGDVLSHPSCKDVTVRVTPPKTYWKAKNAAVRTAAGTKAELEYNEAKGAQRYQIMYSTSKSFKESQTKTKKTKKTQTTLKELKPGKTYYVKIRAMYEFTDSRGNERVLYGKWSSVKNLK